MADHQHRKPFTSAVRTEIDLMDIDQVMVIPDTPDRISKQSKSICNISTPGDSSLRNSVTDNRVIRGRRNRLFSDTARSYTNAEGNAGDAARSQVTSSSAVPPLSSSNVQVSNLIAGKTFKLKDRHNCYNQEMEDDKISHSSSGGISSHYHRSENPVLVEYGDMAKSSPKLKKLDLGARKMDKADLLSSNTIPLHTVGGSSKSSRSDNDKGKVKVGHDDHKSRNALYVKGNDNICLITSDHDFTSSHSRNDKGKVKVMVGNDEPIHSNALPVKGNDNVFPIASAHDTDTEKGPSKSCHWQKRLVRNGCISPHNIANARRIEKTHVIGSENAKRNDNVLPIASDHDTEKVPSKYSHREKRLVRNGCISPHNIANAKRIEKTAVIGSENAECCAASGGSHPVIDVSDVTSKQNVACRAKGKELFIHDSSSSGHASRRNDVGHSTNKQHKGKFPEDCIIVQDTRDNSNKDGIGRNTSLLPSTLLENKSMLNEVHFRTPSSSFKRPKKSPGSLGKNTEVICLSSGGESSTVKSLRDHGGFPKRDLGSSSAVDEISPEVRESISETNIDSEAREIQLQADEILARELQEQLYNESPLFTSRESVSSLGGAEQQEGSLQAAFSINSANDSVVASRFQVQPPQQSLRTRLFRRGPQARQSRSHISRIRSQLLHSPMGRRRLLPSHMDVDMRMHLLESLEAMYFEDTSMVDQLLNSDREFGENDYETLLALDENNHEHLGASVAQISNLPESTVNNDNFETCSICLETPVIGDTIRHLPCLHKFHKDCIDPWLRRKRSCPVCKSDV